MATKDYLDVAQKWFHGNLSELLKEHKGKWAVIHKNKLIGIYNTPRDAYKNGVLSAGTEEVLIRRVMEKNDSPTEISVNFTLGVSIASN